MFGVHCKMLDGEPQMFPTCYFQHRAVLIEGWQYQQQQQLVLPVLVEGQLWLGEGWTFRQMSLRGVWLWKKKQMMMIISRDYPDGTDPESEEADM